MRKIAILGPESTGKTTLAQQLAEKLHTFYVPEYAREYLKDFVGKYQIEDVVQIAVGQQRNINQALEEQPDYLIVDTEQIVNKIWCEYVFHQVPEIIQQLLDEQKYDLYLLCDIDLEWTYDPLRENPDIEERKEIFQLYVDNLNHIKANFVVINGQDNERLDKSLQHIYRL